MNRANQRSVGTLQMTTVVRLRLSPVVESCELKTEARGPGARIDQATAGFERARVAITLRQTWSVSGASIPWRRILAAPMARVSPSTTRAMPANSVAFALLAMGTIAVSAKKHNRILASDLRIVSNGNLYVRRVIIISYVDVTAAAKSVIPVFRQWPINRPFFDSIKASFGGRQSWLATQSIENRSPPNNPC
jgi:hypothetical protein